MNKLNIFVSSTCYDLSQIRLDLHDHIESSGHVPVLSEFKTFPINPTSRILDNCINAVKNNADIFILIVGNRYGSEIESGKSITNTEFLTAKDKGIPLYIFIDKKIINILPVWQKNKTGDYSNIVDTTKIFEFISTLRNDSQLWSYEFENAQDIISILRTQMSYLFKESLNIRAKYNGEVEELFKKRLSNDALNILFNKGDIFEIEFLFQTLIDELSKKETIKNDYHYKILLQSKHAIFENEDLIGWIQQRISVLSNLIESINRLIKEAFPKFYAEPGVPSDLKGIFYISETYARIYEHIVQWTIETSTTFVPEECINLRVKLSNLSSKTLDQIWKFPFDQMEELKSMKEKLERGETSLTLNSVLTIELDEKALEEYYIEFENYKSIVMPFD